MIRSIKDILDASDKAEIVEKLDNALTIQGSKVTIIIGLPNEQTGDLEMEILNFGLKYLYEAIAFLGLGSEILEQDDSE